MFDISVPIPESLYEEATHAAKAERVSPEQFIAESVQLRLHDGWEEPEVLFLSDEQMAEVRKAQAEMKAGKFLTMEQLNASSAANRAAWLKENQL